MLKKWAGIGRKTSYSVTPAVHKLVYWSGWKTEGSPKTTNGAYITGCPSQCSTFSHTLPLQMASPGSLELQHRHCPAHSCALSALMQPLDLVVVFVCVIRNEVSSRILSHSLLILIVSSHLPRHRSVCYMQLQNYSDLFYTYTQVPFLRQHKLFHFSYLQDELPQLLVLWWTRCCTICCGSELLRFQWLAEDMHSPLTCPAEPNSLSSAVAVPES